MYAKLTSQFNRKHKGYTLTEAIVASALLFVAIVPILKALTSAQLTSRIIERKTHCLTLAQNKLNEITARSIYHYDDSFAESSVAVDGTYLCTVTDDANDTLRTIAVSVGQDGNANSSLDSSEIDVTLKTYLARRQ